MIVEESSNYESQQTPSVHISKKGKSLVFVKKEKALLLNCKDKIVGKDKVVREDYRNEKNVEVEIEKITNMGKGNNEKEEQILESSEMFTSTLEPINLIDVDNIL